MGRANKGSGAAKYREYFRNWDELRESQSFKKQSVGGGADFQGLIL